MTSGNRPAAEQGSWHVPGARAYQPPNEVTHQPGPGRPGVVALVVALTELVIIAAACNQSVTKHAVRYGIDHSSSFLGRAVVSSLQFAWRLTPAHGDHRTYYGQLLTIGVFLVLSALLAAVATRGTVTFWRVFLTVWTGVLAAACVACAVAAMATEPAGGHRATHAVFVTVSGYTVFAGAVIGLVAALVAALFAVATRRTVTAPAAATAAPEPAYVPETPPPFYGNPPRPAAEQPAETQDPDGRTMQIPRFDPAGGKHWQPPTQDESTQAMPAAPDDERRG